MKQFIKNNKLKKKNLIVVIKDGKQIINPSEELILADGWLEHVKPELTEEQELQLEIQSKKTELDLQSKELKSFILNNEECTFDTDTLNKMMFRVMAESAMNINHTTLWFNDKAYKFKTKDAMELLYKLLIYSGECFDVVNEQKNEVSKLKSKDDIKNYKHRDKYPDRINININ